LMGGWKDHAKATKKAVERTSELLEAFAKEKAEYVAQKIGFSSKFIPSKYEAADMEADLAVCTKNEEALEQMEEDSRMDEKCVERIEAAEKQIQAHLEKLWSLPTFEERKQKLETLRGKIKLKDGTRALLRFLDGDYGGPNPLQVEELQAEVGRLTEEVEKMAKAKEASDIEREERLTELAGVRAELEEVGMAKMAWDAEREAYQAETWTMANAKEAWGAEREAWVAERNAWDAERKAYQAEAQTMAREMEARHAELAEVKETLEVREEELRSAREEKAKRCRELEEDELESRKRQKHASDDDEQEIHPLLHVAESIVWTLRDLPLSMQLEQCCLVESANELFSLLLPIARDTAMWDRLCAFTRSGPPIGVSYCLRAVGQLGVDAIDPDARCGHCGGGPDGGRCMLITKNEDGTIYFRSNR